MSGISFNIWCYVQCCMPSMCCLNCCVTSSSDQVDEAIVICNKTVGGGGGLDDYEYWRPEAKPKYLQIALDLLQKAFAQAAPDEAFQLYMKFVRRAQPGRMGAELHVSDACKFHTHKVHYPVLNGISEFLLGELKKLSDGGHLDAKTEYLKTQQEIASRDAFDKREAEHKEREEDRISRLLDRPEVAAKQRAYHAAQEEEVRAERNLREANIALTSAGIRAHQRAEDDPNQNYYTLKGQMEEAPKAQLAAAEKALETAKAKVQKTRAAYEQAIA